MTMQRQPTMLSRSEKPDAPLQRMIRKPDIGPALDLADIVEVVQTNIRGANTYLSAGYRLLAVCEAAHFVEFPPEKKSKLEGFTLKHVVCVLGRTADVTAIPDPRPKPETPQT